MRVSSSSNQSYNEVLELLLEFASPYIDNINMLAADDQASQIPNYFIFQDVFHGFLEISGALDALNLYESLFRLSPPRSKKIDKALYLQFLVGAYLQEMYILEQRLRAYATKISRMYKQPSLKEHFENLVYVPLKEIIITRGAHVHERRYSDETLKRVSMFALFRSLNHEHGADLEVEYGKAQKEWSNRVKVDNKAINKIIDQYCKLLKGVICKNGKIVLPS